MHKHMKSYRFTQNVCPNISAVKATLNNGVNPIGVLVGNKSDLRDGTIDSRAEVPSSEAKNLAAGLGLQFFETSAVSCIWISLALSISCSFYFVQQANVGVEEPFKYIAEEFLKR